MVRPSLVVLTIAFALVGSKGAGAGVEASGVIAFERTGGGQSPTAIYLMNTDGSDQRLLTTGYHFEWSPDGAKIAFHRPSSGDYDDIWVIGRDGGDLRRLVSNKAYGELTWSPDGRQLAFTGPYTIKGFAIFVVNSDGTGLARLTSPKGDVMTGCRTGRPMALRSCLSETGSTSASEATITASSSSR